MNQNFISFAILGIAFLVVIFIIVPKSSSKEPQIETSKPTSITKVSEELGTQIIEVKAKGGYSPQIIEAEANKNTILRVTTMNTFDCSASFSIPKYKIAKVLPPTGTTDFDIGSHKPGEVLDGTCSMGMYGFKIKFN